MALAAYTPQPHKFNRFNKNGLFGRDNWDIDFNFPEGCPLRVTPLQGVAIEPTIAADSTKIDKIEIHYTGVEEVGFPIKVTTMSRIPAYTSKMEVTELSTPPLDPALV